jgi:hypothetical protein
MRGFGLICRRGFFAVKCATGVDDPGALPNLAGALLLTQTQKGAS